MMKKGSLERRVNRTGYLFLLPWMIGVACFFVIPFLKSVLYAFSDVSFEESGIQLDWVGLENFRYILLQDSNYNRQVVTSVQQLITNVPIIMFFSIFIALLLNQQFIGRTAMRAIFFLPVIIASGMVIKIIRSDVFVQTGMAENTEIFQTSAVQEFLFQMNISPELVDFLTKTTSQIFDLSWKSGLQILMYLSAIQSIPQVYYEVAVVEGANSWDAFWKITFPVLSPTSLLVVVYTIIDSFTDFNNQVMQQILQRIDNVSYGYAASSALVYFIVIGLIIGMVYLLTRKKVFYNSD